MENPTYLAFHGWKTCKPCVGFEHLGACYAAPWDTGNLYAIPEADALRIARFALATGAQYTPTCAKLAAFELEQARFGHARMLRKGA